MPNSMQLMVRLVGIVTVSAIIYVCVTIVCKLFILLGQTLLESVTV